MSRGCDLDHLDGRRILGSCWDLPRGDAKIRSIDQTLRYRLSSHLWELHDIHAEDILHHERLASLVEEKEKVVRLTGVNGKNHLEGFSLATMKVVPVECLEVFHQRVQPLLELFLGREREAGWDSVGTAVVSHVNLPRHVVVLHEGRVGAAVHRRLATDLVRVDI